MEFKKPFMQLCAISMAGSLQVAAAQGSSLQAYAFSAAGYPDITVSGPNITRTTNFGDCGGIFCATWSGAPAGDVSSGTSHQETYAQQYYSSAAGPIGALSQVGSVPLYDGSTLGGALYTGNAGAKASYGVVGVASGGAVAGSLANFGNPQAHSSESIATWTDTLTITGGTGNATFHPTFTVYGDWRWNPGSAVQMELDYGVDGSAPLMLYRIQADSYYSGPQIYYGGFQGSLPGLTVTSNSVTGATDVSFDVPFTFGTGFALKMLMYGSVLAGASSSGSVDFQSGARLTGVGILQNGQPVDGWSISSSSGMFYSRQGIDDSYDQSTRQLTIPSVVIGAANYSDMVVTIASVVTPPSGIAPIGMVDTYDPASRLLTVPAVKVGSTSYYNAAGTVRSLVSIGGVSGADTYDPASNRLSIPLVQVLGGSTYHNAIITVGGIVRVDGGMPTATNDQYTPATRQLLIPAVRANGRVYTNVVITVAAVVSVNP